MWVAFLKFIAGVALSFVAQLLLGRQKPPPAGEIEDSSIPKAKAGDPKPEIYGRVYISNPQVHWWGDVKVKAIKKSSFFGLVKTKVGNRYFMGLHFILARRADRLLGIYADRKPLVESAIEEGVIDVNEPTFWGGRKREGGIVGTFRLMLGGAAQGINSYLQSVLGTPLPAFRNSVSVVLEQVEIGNAPSLRPFSFAAELFEQTQDGSPQWYPEKVRIASSDSVGAYVNDLQASAVVLQAQAASATGDPLAVSDEACVDPTGWEPKLGLPGAYIAEVGGALAFVQNGDQNAVFQTTGSEFPKTRNALNLGAEIWDIAFDLGSMDRLQYLLSQQRQADSIFNIGVNSSNQLTFTVYHTLGGTTITSLTTLQEGVRYYIGAFFDQARGMFLYLGSGGTPRANLVASDTLTEFGPLRNNSGNDPVSFGIFGPSGSTDNNREFEGSYRAIRVTTDLDAVPDPETGTAVGSSNFDRQSLPLATGCPLPSQVLSDMNPAHILRQNVPRPIGTGWTAAADTLHAEGFGLSFKFDNPGSRQEFVEQIEDHIDGLVYQDRRTGLWELKLIRQEDPDLAPVFDRSNVIDWIGVEKPDPWSLPNTLTVTYTGWAARSTASVTLTNPARVAKRGKIIAPSQPRSYPGIVDDRLAAKVCARDLHAIGMPLWRGSIRVRYLPPQINRGSLIVLDNPSLGLVNVPVRVRRIEDASSREHDSIVHFVEDAVRVPAEDLIEVERKTAGRDVSDPELPDPRLVEEVPYWLLARSLGVSGMEARLGANADLGYLQATAGQPTADAVQMQIHVDAGGGYVETGVADFCPISTLAEDLDPLADQVEFRIAYDASLADVENGTLAIVDGEYLRVEYLLIDADLGGATLFAVRGVGDTVPATHDAGAPIIFWGEFSATDEIERGAGDVLDVKLLTETPTDDLDIAAAEADQLTMAARAVRPYPVGQLKIEDTYAYAGILPAISTVTWVGRDRTQQLDELLEGHDAAAIGPEVGVSYTVELRAVISRADFYGTPDFYTPRDFYIGPEVGTLMREIGVASATTWDFDEDEAPDFYAEDDLYARGDFYGTLSGDALQAEIALRTDRDGYSNWQTPRIRAQHLAAPGLLEAEGY